MDAIKIIGEIEIGKLSLRAGDIFVARYSGRLSTDMAARVRAAFEPHIPVGVKVLVIDQEFELSTIDAARGCSDQRGDEVA